VSRGRYHLVTEPATSRVGTQAVRGSEPRKRRPRT